MAYAVTLELYLAELQMVTKSSPLSDAPPTRKPSMSSMAASVSQLPAFTDPPAPTSPPPAANLSTLSAGVGHVHDMR